MGQRNPKSNAYLSVRTNKKGVKVAFRSVTYGFIFTYVALTKPEMALSTCEFKIYEGGKKSAKKRFYSQERRTA